MRELLGGKGANLAEMTNIGLPVPQGFTITTEACTRTTTTAASSAPEIQDEIMKYMAKLEKMTGKKFGDPENPLLVSVRSGARASMPGMMDTILNLGLNDEVVEAWPRRPTTSASPTTLPPLHPDVRRRRHGACGTSFEERLDQMKEAKGVKLDTELTPRTSRSWWAVQGRSTRAHRRGVPPDPEEQLMGPSRPCSVPGTTRAPTSTAA
jgi:pyruvate,orthophosphate dikinase